MEPGLLRQAADLAERGVACAVAVVMETRGSVPGKLGATMLVTADGTSRGTVGGAGLEERVKRLCRDALASGTGGMHTFDLAAWKQEGLDSMCGGTVAIAISLVNPVPHLLIVGGGHCSQSLAKLCDHLDYGYTVVDSRAAFASDERFPNARAVLCGDPSEFIRLAEDLSTFSHAYLIGFSHQEDGAALIALLERGFSGIIGVIGSRAKMHAFRRSALERGIAESAIARVRSPIGVDIGAQTPAEIGVAVAAEVIRDVRLGGGSGGTARRVPPGRTLAPNDHEGSHFP
ncbi:MAG: XdhC/CoxI family protein [Candidatus Thermoplasmatota archaeon]